MSICSIPFSENRATSSYPTVYLALGLSSFLQVPFETRLAQTTRPKINTRGSFCVRCGWWLVLQLRRFGFSRKLNV